jgi:hypothetical protein
MLQRFQPGAIFICVVTPRQATPPYWLMKGDTSGSGTPSVYWRWCLHPTGARRENTMQQKLHEVDGV